MCDDIDTNMPYKYLLANCDINDNQLNLPRRGYVGRVQAVSHEAMGPGDIGTRRSLINDVS